MTFNATLETHKGHGFNNSAMLVIELDAGISALRKYMIMRTCLVTDSQP